MATLFKRLRLKVDAMEAYYRIKIQAARRKGHYHEQVEEIVGYLEGSVEFIINDCLKDESDQCRPKLDHHSTKENVKNRPNWSRGRK